MVKQYGEWIVRHPIWVLLLSVITIMVFASGGLFLVFTNDYRVFFSPDNPQLLAFEELQETYTKNDNILIMLEPDGGDVFTPEVLAAVADLTEEAWQVPYSVRVDSITNFQHTYSEGDDLLVEDLVDDASALDADKLEEIRTIALDQPALINRLLSANSQATGVNITVNLPDELSDADRLLPKEERDKIDPAIAIPKAVFYTRNLIKSMEEKYPDIKFYKTGVVIMNQAFPEAAMTDMKTIIPMAFGVIIVGILLLIRSPVSMLGTVLVVALSILGAMGTAGWLGIKLTPPSVSAPTLILTLAVADCVHFLVSLYHGVRQGNDKKSAVVESLRINMMPIFLTSVTTAIGFLSMNFSDAPPFRDLGNITAIGVMFAFLLAVTFLPAFATLMPVRAKQIDTSKATAMDKLSNFVTSAHRPLFWGMLACIIVLTSFVPKNELNDVFVNYFDKSLPFRAETDHVTETLSGLYIIDYSLDSKEEGGISDPAFLKQVEQFVAFLETQPGVQHVNTFTETLRRLNRSMHNEDEAYYRIPDDRELSAQLQLMYEMSLPYGLDLNNQINFDKSATRVTVTMRTMSTQEVLALESRVIRWMQENTPEIATLGSGTTTMFSHIGMRNIISMLTGTSIALVLISVILIFALKSLKFGLISLIPNITPALMAFGVWGITRGEVGLAVSVVVAMTMGIVVDDTIHFLSKYLRARREQGMNTEDAIKYAFNTVGVALLVTTIVLVAGFMVIAQSNFLVNSQMGLLTALTIAIALIVDFLFLPPLLMRLDKDKIAESKPEDLSGGIANPALQKT